MKKYYFIKLLLIYLIFLNNSIASQSDYLEKGIRLFNEKKYEESKILFERDIVFNPKSEKSYLYLAKILKLDDKDDEYEINLNNVLLLNPKNDEAIYMLALLKIEQSDYEYVKELVEQFNLVCRSLCSKKDEIQEKLDKLTPENEKDNN
tara:strand:- start:252 stop:698 length:447 start_codon:yes stop_codon:yes gene_type:complete